MAYSSIYIPYAPHYYSEARIGSATMNAYRTIYPGDDWDTCPWKEEWYQVTKTFISNGLDISKMPDYSFSTKAEREHFFKVLELSLKSPNLET